MHSGALRHALVIQRATEAINEVGEAVKSWATFASVWGAIEPQAVREYNRGQQVTGEVTHKITIRYLEGITQKDRVTCGARTFHIVGISDKDERHAEMALLVKETV